MRPQLTLSLLSVSYRSSDYPGGATAIERFWQHVDCSGGPDACWPWIGADNGVGYGRITIAHYSFLVTRVSYVIAGNDLPDDLDVCHSCDNPPCCNPAHLSPGTKHENMDDAKQKGRIAHGSRTGTARLTEGDIPIIRTAYGNGETLAAIADRYGVTFQTISKIVRRERWTHVQELDVA